MSTSIDERVVYMKFDNKNFENNAQTSLRTLDRLKESLNFKDVQGKLNDINLSGLKSNVGEAFSDVDTSKFMSAMDKIEYRMSTLGQFTGRIVQNVADDLYSIIKKATDGIEKVVDVTVGGIVQGGYRRASNIQTAKFQLEGVGIAWDEIKGDIDYAVTNTAYSLDQAALVASQLASAGLKPGTQYITAAGEERDIDTMAMILKSISGTAAQSGGLADYSTIGRDFIQLISRGKVMGTDLNELSSKTGINVREVVAAYMSEVGYMGRSDWSYDDIAAMTEKGTFTDPMILIEAMYERFGEHASKANETLSGVMANTKSALARIGENFFEPIIENGGPLVSMFEVLRQSINALNNTIKPIVRTLGEGVANRLSNIVGLFAEKEEILDEEGNVIGTQWNLKKKGGLFSDFVEDLYVGEWKEKGIPGLSEHTYVEFDGEVTTRAAIIMQNLTDSFFNTVDAIKATGQAISDGIRAVFPNADSLAEKIVKITTKIKEFTEAWKNGRFLKDGGEWQKSDLFHIVRGLAAAVDIVRRFGASFKKHILDPIFNKGGELVKKSGLWDYFIGFFDSIYEFDQKLKNFDGDYFGPFFEKTKEIFGNLKDLIMSVGSIIGNFFKDNIGPTIRDGFNNIVEWWKPVKEILFDSDLTLNEKWQAIKDYFTQNFELPGWTKVKEVFSSLADTVSDAWDKIKTVFGFGKKEDEVTLTTAGAGLLGNNHMYGSLGQVETNFTVRQALEMMDTDTEKMPTIAERIKNFFSSISESIRNTDFDGINAAIIGFGVALAIAISAVAYVLIKAYQTFTYVAFKLPVIFGDMLTSVDNLLRETSRSLAANRMQTVASTVKTIAITLGILLGAFLTLAGVLILVKKYDTDGTYIKSLKEAAIFIGVAFGVLATIAWAITTASGSLTEEIGLTKEGLKIARVTSGLASVIAIFGAITSAVITMSVLIVALGALDLIKPGLFEKGKDRLIEILKTLGIMVGVIAAVNFLLGRVTQTSEESPLGITKTKTINRSLFGMASVITGVTTALVAFTGVIFALSLFDAKKFEAGMDRLKEVSWAITVVSVVTYGLLSIVNLLPKTETLAAGKIVGLLLGLSIMMTAVTGALFTLTLSMSMLARSLDKHGIDPGEMIGIMLTLGAMMTILPALLLVAAKFAFKDLNTGNLIALSVFMLVLGITSTIIAGAVEKLADVDPWQMTLAFVFLAALLLGSEAILVPLSKYSTSPKTLTAALGIGLMLTSLYPAALAIERLADLGWSQWISGLGMIVSTMVVIGGITMGLEWLSTKLKIQNAAKLGLNVLLFTLAMIPLGAGVALMMKAFDMGAGLNYWEKMGVIAATLVAYGALVAGTMVLVNTLQSEKPVSIKKALATLTTVWTVSLAMIPIAAAISLMFIALGHSNLDALSVGGIMLGFGALIALIAVAINQLTTSIGKTHLTGGQMASVIGVIVSALISLATVGVVLGLVINQIASVNASIQLVGMAALVIIGISITILFLIQQFVKIAKDTYWNQNTMKGILVTLGSFSIIISGMFVLSRALIPLASLDPTALLVSAGILAGLSVVIGFIVGLLLRLVVKKLGASDVSGAIITMGAILVVSASLFIVAQALTQVATIDSDKIFRAGLVLSVMGAVITAMTTIIVIMSNAITDWKSGLITLGIVLACASSLYITAKALMQISTINEDKIYKTGLVLSVMGAVITAMAAVAIIVGSNIYNWEGALLGIGSVIACAGSLYLVAIAMKKLENMDFERLVHQMILFGGGLTLMALILMVVGSATAGIGTATIAAFAAMAVGLALTMLAAGAFMWLAADAIDKGVTAIALLIDTIIGLKDKKSEFSEGMVTFFEGVVDGLTAGLKRLDEKLPVITFYLNSILGQLKGFILTRVTNFFQFALEFLRIALRGIADIVTDADVQKSLNDIINGILDFTLENAGEWTEKLVRIGQAMAAGIVKGLFSAEAEDFWNALISGNIANAARLASRIQSAFQLDTDKELTNTTDITASEGRVNSSSEADFFGSYTRRKALESPDYEDYNVATAKRNASKSSGSGNSFIQDYVNEQLEKLNSPETKQSVEQAASDFVDIWEDANNSAWDKLTKSDDTNLFSSFIGNSLIEYQNSLSGGPLGQSISKAVDNTHTTFSDQFSGKSGGVGGTLAPMYGTLGNPVWNNSIISATTFLGNSINKGEIKLKLTNAIDTLHSLFNNLLNSNTSATSDSSDSLSGMLLNPFTRRIVNLLNNTMISINGSVVTDKIQSIATTLFNKFNSEINPATMLNEMVDVGEAVTAGIYVGMVSPNSLWKLKKAGITVADACIAALKSDRAFSIHSPAERVYEEITKMIYGALTQMKSSDIANINLSGMLAGDTWINGNKKAIENADDPADMYYQQRTAMNNAAAAQGSADGQSYVDAFGGEIDISSMIGGIGDKIRGNFNANVGSLEDLLPDFSWDKGISGNIDAAKEAWGNIKSIFTNDSGNFDISWLFAGVSEQVQSGKDQLLSQFGLGGENGLDFQSMLGIDENALSGMSVEDLGINMEITGSTFGTDFENGFGEFGGWDANDLMSNNTIDINTNIDLDQQTLDDFLSKNTTLDMASSVPVGGGYRQSTIGSTYVNNYSYNQTNNSPSALNTREINRQNELLLNRRRTAGRY